MQPVKRWAMRWADGWLGNGGHGYWEQCPKLYDPAMVFADYWRPLTEAIASTYLDCQMADGKPLCRPHMLSDEEIAEIARMRKAAEKIASETLRADLRFADREPPDYEIALRTERILEVLSRSR